MYIENKNKKNIYKKYKFQKRIKNINIYKI